MRRPRLAILALILSLCAPSAHGAATTRPGVGIVCDASSTRATIQNAVNTAAAKGYAVVIDPGTYKVDQPIVVPNYAVVRGTGIATLVGTKPGPILLVSGGDDGVIIEGLAFQGAVPGVTGIAGNLVRSRVRDCDFWTSLSYGVDVHGLLTRITDCRFGVHGDVPKAFQHIRIRSGDGSSNAWEIDHCAFYNAAGDCAVEVGDGYQLDFHHNNVERCRTRVAVKVAGMFTVHIGSNWLENNTGDAQIELTNDKTNQIGNYSVVSERNFVNLSSPGNRWVYSVTGASHVTARNESGTSMSGKPYANDPAGVTIDGPVHMVGWAQPDQPPPSE